MYTYDENWIGGTYYIINLIKALNTLEFNDKPHIYIFTSTKENYLNLKQEVQYPFMEYWPFIIDSLFKRGINKFWRSFFKSNFFDNRPKTDQLEFLFPNPTGSFYDLLTDEIKVQWIPDFQDKHLPHFFSDKIRSNRDKVNKDIAFSNHHLVLSSKHALRDFEMFYPEATCCTHVLPFVVIHPSLEGINELDTLKKLELKEKYVYVPNQFWVHKNHRVVLKALRRLLERGVSIQFVFSGKEHDERSDSYLNELRQFIKDNELAPHCKFLGFLDREIQLIVLKNAHFVIQPSLFEGWSTVIEDCKAMNKFVIASDIPVHREQISENVFFFEAHDDEKLALATADFYNELPPLSETKYEVKVKNFAHRFLGLVDSVISASQMK